MAEECRVKIDIVFWIDLMILSPPGKLVRCCAWPSKMVVIDLTEWQLWSCMVRGCLANMTPVSFL